jgi:predicted transglutaminase-like cysteine proteinase
MISMPGRYRPLVTFLVGALLLTEARARDFSQSHASSLALITEGPPTLAPFQHVRFCLRYPSECKTAEFTRNIDFDLHTFELLKSVNRGVNRSIAATVKRYGPSLEDGWTIAPAAGDCNDYAVTKRHELIEGGFPSGALRLAVVRTASGIGHLVLVVSVSDRDLVLDNLTETIRPWQDTGYQWLKIQSATDVKYWYEVKSQKFAASHLEQ